MNAVAAIAPEVDRLVFAIKPAISERDDEALRRAMAEIELESAAELLATYAEFFIGNGITTELAETRKPYSPQGQIRAHIEALAEAGVLQSTDNGWVGTEKAASVLARIAEGHRNAAISLWGGHLDDVATANRYAQDVISNASDDHTVADAHRSLVLPDDPCAALYRRLVTLRYIRQHDHMAAWRAENLTAGQMVVLTELWYDGTVDPDSEDFQSLVAAGYATDPPDLTDRGHAIRDSIEEATNRLNAEDFDVLGPEAAASLLATLKALPPH